MSTSIGSTTVNPMKTFSFTPLSEPDSPHGYGSGFGSGYGSFLPWPTSYPHWLSAVNYEDIFSEVEDVLIWGSGDSFFPLIWN